MTVCLWVMVCEYVELKRYLPLLVPTFPRHAGSLTECTSLIQQDWLPASLTSSGTLGPHYTKNFM